MLEPVRRAGPEHLDRTRALSFGDDPATYDKRRPSYPMAMVDDLMAASPCRVLDVGCGTGIASRLFAVRGCNVIGLEPDERMAAFARSKGTTVEVATFETWQAPPEPFDLIISAQAWHWVDPAIGPQKAARVLVPGGRFAAFWNQYGHDPQTTAAFEEVYRRQAPQILEKGSLPLGNPLSIIANQLVTVLDGSGLYAKAEVRWYPWEQAYTSQEWIDHISTISDHKALAPETLKALLDAVSSAVDSIGGQITVHFNTVSVTAVRCE